ncbi:MAG: hypothetical protein IIB55_04215 [Planctomycetes bacterium]|nr:hypothetical protein [Planctomycetota bacterium]
MTKTLRVTLMTGVLAVPGVALADLPPALDRVTMDSALVVGVSNINNVLAGIEAIEATGLEGFSDMTDTIKALEGVNLDGSLAMGMLLGDEGFEGEPDMFVILPVSDYGEFRDGLGGEGAGVVEVFIEGEAVYLADIGGGFCIIGSTVEIAERYADVRGSVDALEAMIGPAGLKAVDHSDVFVLVNLQALRPFLEEEFSEAMDGMEMMGPEMVAMGPMIDMYRVLGDRLFEDGRGAVLGVGFGQNGLTLSSAAQFAEGSKAAALLSGKSDSSSLLAHVPDAPFFLALAADTSTELFKAANEFGMEMNRLQAEAMGMEMPKNDMSLIEGYAVVMGSPPGGVMGGILSASTVYMASSSPGELVDQYRQMFDQFETIEMPMMSMGATYTEDAASVAGHAVDTWSMEFQFDQNNPAVIQMQRAMMMIAGPGGFGGFIAELDRSMVMTMSLNPRLMESAIEAAEHGGGMGDNPMILAAAEHLPANRALEMYVGVEEMFVMFGALAAMGQLPIQIDLPDDVPAIAMGLSIGRGGALGMVFVPHEVLEVAGQLADQLPGQGVGMESDF